jgi:hypothetical protein
MKEEGGMTRVLLLLARLDEDTSRLSSTRSTRRSGSTGMTTTTPVAQGGESAWGLGREHRLPRGLGGVRTAAARGRVRHTDRHRAQRHAGGGRMSQPKPDIAR